jgi:hypothetical protein
LRRVQLERQRDTPATGKKTAGSYLERKGTKLSGKQGHFDVLLRKRIFERPLVL